MLPTVLMLLVSSVFAHAETPTVQVRSVQAVGSGCPQGSYSATISPEGDSFSLLLDQYVAESTRQQTMDRKNCQLRVDFNVPTGWQFSVVSADYRGFANVEGGSVVTHQAIYSFDGSRPPNERPGPFNGRGHALNIESFRGPFQDNYYIHNDIDPRKAIWSPCGEAGTQTLFISTFLTARSMNQNSPSSAMITLDSIDGLVQSQKFQFAWKACGSRLRPGPPGGGPPRGDHRGPPGRPPRFR